MDKDDLQGRRIPHICIDQDNSAHCTEATTGRQLPHYEGIAFVEGSEQLAYTYTAEGKRGYVPLGSTNVASAISEVKALKQQTSFSF